MIPSMNLNPDDGLRRFNLLKQELTDKKNYFLLTQQMETYKLDKVKDLDTIDKALEMSQELVASKKALDVAHASLQIIKPNMKHCYSG